MFFFRADVIPQILRSRLFKYSVNEKAFKTQKGNPKKVG
jgi:hypothetical protein